MDEMMQAPRNVLVAAVFCAIIALIVFAGLTH